MLYANDKVWSLFVLFVLLVAAKLAIRYHCLVVINNSVGVLMEFSVFYRK